MTVNNMHKYMGDHHDTLRHVTGYLHEAIRAIGGDLSVGQLLIFMEVARANATGHAIDMKELQILIGGSSGSQFSRHVAAMLVQPREGVSGLGLLEQRENPKDRRRKQLVLTDKGIKLRSMFARYIQKDIDQTQLEPAAKKGRIRAGD